MIHYNPHNWYWLVSEKSGFVYSSLYGTYQELDNEEYKKWLELGNLTTVIENELLLDQVLISEKIKPVTTAAAMGLLRAERDAKLAATDWIVVKSYEAGEPVPQVWIDYRQSLRDLPQNTTDPFNPMWPQQP